MIDRTGIIDRRDVLRGATMATARFASVVPAWTRPVPGGIVRLPAVSGTDITLAIAHRMLAINGRDTHAIGINGTVPGPPIRPKEGHDVRLDEDSPIYRHGLQVPPRMGGVPGIRFPAVQPRSRLTCRFPFVQGDMV